MAHTAAAAAAAAIVPATVAARGARLQTKAQQGRRTDDIALLMPAGAAAMKAKPARTAFPDGVGGDKAWAKATREAASDFVLATRQASTAVEHVSYMLEWNDLLGDPT